MPFGMKNSPATFQCLVNSLIFNLVGCKAYIDDAIIFSKEWERHLQTIRDFSDISDFPVPSGKRQLMRFLSMAGYYRKFCNNFSVIAEPLTNLLGKRVEFIWTDNCQKAFDKLKAILKNAQFS